MTPLHARLQLRGGWGAASLPSFAYDLSRGALWNRAKRRGLLRYGPAPGSPGDDTRPIALAYSRVVAPQSHLKSGWTATSEIDNPAKSLVEVNKLFGLSENGLTWANSTPNELVSIVGPELISENGGVVIWGRIYQAPDEQKLKLWSVHWGEPGAGCLFQIRDGRPEFARLSANWNAEDQTALRQLWALESPTNADTAAADALEAAIYDGFEQLSFERTLGRDSWIGAPFCVAFVPEPRGVIHIMPEGGSGLAHEIPARMELSRSQPDAKVAPIWAGGAPTVSSEGGVFSFVIGHADFPNEGELKFGPMKNGYWADAWDGAQFSHSAQIPRDGEGGALGAVTFERNALDAVSFEFVAKLQTSDPAQTPWLYGLSARLKPGARVFEDAVSLDTANLPQNSDGVGEFGNPIKNISLSVDGATGARRAVVTMRDIRGRTSASSYEMDNRAADLSIDGVPLITRGVVVETVRGGMGSLAVAPVAVTGRANSEIVLTIADGWQILAEVPCFPSPIGDGLKLGQHLRDVLQLAGFNTAEMAGVDANFGYRLPRAAAGESWACRSDGAASCADYIRSLLDSFGGNNRFHQGADGVWKFEARSSEVKAEFWSDRNAANAAGKPRNVVLAKLDWIRTIDDFYNRFTVIGGEGGEISGTRTVGESINRPTQPTWIGRARPLAPVVNPALRSANDVNFALRSLSIRKCKPGRRAQFTTYFAPLLLDEGDAIIVDGRACEVISISGADLASDQMQIVVRETQFDVNVAPDPDDGDGEGDGE